MHFTEERWAALWTPGWCCLAGPTEPGRELDRKALWVGVSRLSLEAHKDVFGNTVTNTADFCESQFPWLLND